MTPMRIATVFWVTAFALLLTAGSAVATDAPRMTVEELNSRLGAPKLVVIDTRKARDWGSSATQIKGAVRRDPKAVASWAEEYERTQTIVVYCA